MPYDTNGNYSLPTIYYAISGTVINPSQHNTPFEDVQAALNRPLLRDGTAPMTGNLNANGNKITNLAKGTADTDAVTFAQLGDYATQAWANTAFVKNSNGTDGGIVSAAIDASGVPAFLSGEGVWYQVQLKGDYATNPALSTEAYSRANADENLQNQVNNRVLKSGDTMTGGLTIKGGTSGFTAQYNPGSPASDTYINYPGFTSIAEGRGGEFHCQVQEHVGYKFIGLFSLRGSSGNWRYMSLPEGARINDSDYGDVAYTEDLAGYVSASAYVADFSTSDPRVTNLPYNQREVGFNVLITSNGQYVPFPEAFASTPVSIICGDCGNDAGKTDAWPICAPLDKCTAAGCNVYIGSAAVPRRVSIIAKGSR
ncbi:hypothetical protein [Acetobacter cerevisiae]|uniref:hypothetical protein n=1 Tax=Acetobacter cerevisiae TaxID=178900 RepID=UPI000783698B|nr:hypothetical protein [Acetobacter cerevisiae]